MTRDPLALLAPQVKPYGLFVMGHFCEGEETLVLVGADSDFWNSFKRSDEFVDALPDPIDRWSKRILYDIAHKHDGTAVFPSDGPPFEPFIEWATKTGRFWQSPTGMLVHDTAGLMISIRGAVKLPFASSSSQIASNPCDSCASRPCAVACPISALSPDHFYDVPKCKAYLDTLEGNDCMSGGCLVRQGCPVSQSFNRPKKQSAFHMNAFMGIKPPLK